MVRARARGVDRVRLGSGHGGGQHLAIFRKPKVFSKSSRILTIEHLALERVGLVLGPTDKACCATAVEVGRALEAPILEEDAPVRARVLISLGLVCGRSPGQGVERA